MLSLGIMQRQHSGSFSLVHEEGVDNVYGLGNERHSKLLVCA